MTAPESSFRRYITTIPEFNDYFLNRRQKTKQPTPIRFENGLAEQAQLDWKESMSIVLYWGNDSGEHLCIVT